MICSTHISRTPFQSLRRLGVRTLGVGAVVCAIWTISPAVSLAATAEDKTLFSVIAGSLSFSTVPAMPTLTSVTLNGTAQTTNTTMTNFGVADATGSGSGWNVTVAGQSGSEKSAVFAQYCPNATCGTDSKGYVPSGATLPANSLTLSSTGASFAGQSGSTGTAPTLQCGTACNVDSAAAVKIASAALSAGMGTFLTSAFSASSLSLATPTTLKALANSEVYRVNLLWTLGTGP
jgi:putative surface cell wall-binding protein